MLHTRLSEIKVLSSCSYFIVDPVIIIHINLILRLILINQVHYVWDCHISFIIANVIILRSWCGRPYWTNKPGLRLGLGLGLGPGLRQ